MKLLIVDQRISKECDRSLSKAGYTLLKLPPDNNLGQAVCSHPDTVLFYADGELITTADYCDTAPYIFSDIREYCPDVKIKFTSDIRSDKYPHDCIMNALVIDGKIFCKSDSISKEIISVAQRHGYTIHHTNQGYPACSVLAFGNNAITADHGIGRVMENAGINVTYITEGYISLPPHSHGFIGGASGVVANRIYFFGDIMTHPDGELICSVIESAGFIPYSLSDEPLADMGGIIAL